MGNVRTYHLAIGRLCQALAVFAALFLSVSPGVAGPRSCCLTIESDTPCHATASAACCALCGPVWVQGNLSQRTGVSLAFTTADPRPLGAGAPHQITRQPALPPPRT
jgi:hypothetical protein